MPTGDLAPEIATLLAAVAVLLVAMFLPQERHGWCALVTIAGLAVAAALALPQMHEMKLTFSGTYALDGATGWGRLLILAFTAMIAALSPSWFATDRRHGEYYAMLLFSAVGAMAMAGATDLMQLIMGVLLSSVTGYVLAAYHRDWALSLEAGMKYFLIGALANALLVIGVILLMGTAGTTDYSILSGAIPADPLAAAGCGLILLGLFFKLGAVPAHSWMPDVAEGAPAPSAGFLTVIPKIAAAIALIRFVDLVPEDGIPVRLLVALVAAATMTVGNLSALWQTDLRRLLGWSSVSQAGYALMAVASVGAAPKAAAALVGFVGVYGLANIAAFAVVIHLRGRTALDDYAGLLRTQPLAAVTLFISLLSFVGIPPLPGFLGKFALFEASLDAGLGWLAVVAVVNTVISLFYYLRVIGPATLQPAKGQPAVLGGGTRAMVLTGLIAMVAIIPFWDWLWAALPAQLMP